MTVVKFVAIGGLLVAVFAVASAPAGLSRLALEQAENVNLLEPAGTLWNGQGHLSVNGQHLGTLTWDLQVVTILSGALGYDFTLLGEGLDLNGSVRADWDQNYDVTANGRVGEAIINQLMAPYDMVISGDLKLDASNLRIAGNVPTAAGGTVTWDGGLVQYTLSGRKSTAELPAMIAALGTGPEAIVREVHNHAPLLVAKLQDNGFAKVGMTKRLTVLLNNPWPGTAGADEVVLEVEEKVF